MLNLLLLYNPSDNVVKTLHIDEQTGEMYTKISYTTDKDDLLWLEESNKHNCTLTNYTVFKRGNKKSLELCFACDSQFDFEGIHEDEDYFPEPSLIGLFRALVMRNAKLVFNGDMGEELHNLAGMKGSNSSFGLNLPFLSEQIFDTYRWVTVRLMTNDPLGELKNYRNLSFAIPQTSMGEYEEYITRVGLKEETVGDNIHLYDQIKITGILPLVTEKPVAFTTVRVIASLQLLLDAYALILPIIAERLFSSRDIESDSFGYPSKMGHGGFVSIKSNYKIGAALRDRFIAETMSVAVHGLDSSPIWRNNSLYKLFLTMLNTVKQVIEDTEQTMLLWKGMRTSNALITLLMLEAKTHLFFYDKAYLTLLSNMPQFETGILGYNLSIKGGGSQWRPVMSS